ncbi:ABC transporter ATP-binding protein [Clostridium sp.]|uniref:ABC transporter ATP-binding protein n=1 Tax=Clostridium sp. TaxID=1506 RepID=UPI0024B9476D|nr:ABC transporter ATP-binding protein [Clostridium sp.]MDU7261291.1 ABC transporter ATP-binding protein [Clostridium butyricum]MBS4842104.1 ABC transporter ATP-binding protein [Clostridium sp.]MDU1071273.1 ABC transporter ATP-binding protein [Clostridium sp.]MDU2679557.1 ABC transporter ATP-binding protein [Clostridium sp.]MDU4214112.1 ABC transporter ATP-binding protein [Clostridium sp.]
MKDIAIKIENLSKVYKLYDKPVDRLKESFSLSKKSRHKNYYALNDVSLEVKKGEILGIVGTNGSGKSTILKIITGVLTPTSGKVRIEGKISALLELGAGFNPEYTGLQNIYLNGTMMGYSKEEIDKKIEDIVEFADIGDFINQPVKTYSSGMFARLAFAVSINVDPDILIVDEALSVGDTRFQKKCYRKMEELKKRKTIILVTHDIGVISKFCDRVAWIERGILKEVGEPLEIAKKYTAYIMQSQLQHEELEQCEKKESKNDNRLINITGIVESYGDKKALITSIGLFQNDTLVQTIVPNELTKIVIGVEYKDIIFQPIVGFTIKDRLGNIVFQSNSEVLQQEINSDKAYIEYEFKFNFPELNIGQYTISPAIASGTQSNHTQHNWIHDAYVFNIINNNLYNLEGTLSLSNIKFREI